MVSTLLILAVASTALAVAWSVLHSRHTEIRSAQDWEEKKHEIDVRIFRILLESNEERYLLGALSRNQFKAFQRRRISLAWRMLRSVEENAEMLMRLGQLARMRGDAALTQKADELIATAIHLRLNLLLVRLCLSLKWLFPYWRGSVPAFEVRYQHLMDSLAHVQQFDRQTI